MQRRCDPLYKGCEARGAGPSQPPKAATGDTSKIHPDDPRLRLGGRGRATRRRRVFQNTSLIKRRYNPLYKGGDTRGAGPSQPPKAATGDTSKIHPDTNSGRGRATRLRRVFQNTLHSFTGKIEEIANMSFIILYFLFQVTKNI